MVVVAVPPMVILGMTGVINTAGSESVTVFELMYDMVSSYVLNVSVGVFVSDPALVEVLAGTVTMACKFG